MHIRMRTLLAGPAGVFPQGSLQEVDEEQGQALIEAGFAEPASAHAGEVEVEPVEAVEPSEALVELIGPKPAAVLAEHGFPTLADAHAAIAEGLDLTEIQGIGRATVQKLKAL